MERRIHILGASGSGTSTLARTLANRLGLQAFDTDDFYWQPTDPPFEAKRPLEERLALMEAVFLPRNDWILAGPFHTWAPQLADRLTHAVLVTVKPEERLARLNRREVARWGARVGPGGDMERKFRGFMAWAARYDEPAFHGRSLVGQEDWLRRLTIPVIRLEGDAEPDMVADRAAAALDALHRRR